MRWALPIVALIASCGGAADKHKAAPAAHPALWKLSDADTTIYLFGTIHVLPDGLKWRTPRFDRAAASAQELVLEVNDLDDQAKTAETFMKLGISPNLPPALERVPAEKRAGLQALIDKSGVPLFVLDRLETWAIAVTLASGVLKELKLNPDNGVEKQLSAGFKASNRPVGALETTELQLGFFDRLPEKVQRRFLVSMIDDASDAKAEFAKMIGAWTKGDQHGIEITFDDELQLTKELTDALLRQRNANWTAWIADRMNKPGTIMIAVGAGHLAGPDSVRAMLEKRGLKAQRVQ